MKSRIKLDVDYNGNPEIVMDVYYNNEHVLDKLLNKFIDETCNNDLSRGFLIDRNYIKPEIVDCGSETTSNYRGSYSFVPFSRKSFDIPTCIDTVWNSLFPTPDKISTAQIRYEWFYQIQRNAEHTKNVLVHFNQDTNRIDDIINNMKSMTSDEKDNQSYKDCSNCGEDPYSYYDSQEYKNKSDFNGGEIDDINEPHLSFSKQSMDKAKKEVFKEKIDKSKKDILLKLNKIESSLLIFNLNTEDLEEVKKYINRI